MSPQDHRFDLVVIPILMATDGPKIIDGDLANDTYWGIMDLYDSNAEITLIEQEIPFIRSIYGMDEDFYHEIFVTSYALAFWEIGLINNAIIREVKAVIEKGACAKLWTEQIGLEAGKKRQKELDRLWTKISRPNLKVRPRKKYRLIKSLYFQPGDLLGFILPDGFYRAVICAGVDQYRGNCNYMLLPTTFKNKSKPLPKDILACDILGLIIGSGYDREATQQQQPGVESLWHLFPSYDYFFFGLSQMAIQHKDLIVFKNKFEKMGTLKIKSSFNKSGSLGFEQDFSGFEDTFGDLNGHINTFGYHKFPANLICEI